MAPSTGATFSLYPPPCSLQYSAYATTRITSPASATHTVFVMLSLWGSINAIEFLVPSVSSAHDPSTYLKACCFEYLAGLLLENAPHHTSLIAAFGHIPDLTCNSTLEATTISHQFWPPLHILCCLQYYWFRLLWASTLISTRDLSEFFPLAFALLFPLHHQFPSDHSHLHYQILPRASANNPYAPCHFCLPQPTDKFCLWSCLLPPNFAETDCAAETKQKFAVTSLA